MTDIRAPTTATWPICLTNKSTRNRTSRDQIQDRVQITAATELLSAGVDLRTVAGRLGHGGGGATTLRVYAAWVAASDRKAAEILGSRMPKRRTGLSPMDGQRGRHSAVSNPSQRGREPVTPVTPL